LSSENKTPQESQEQSERRFPIVPLRSMVPNMLTILALCSGMFGMRFAILENWSAAVVAILVAGVFDGLDGRVARMLKGTSKFGAELDSLSDIVSFGVAPALIMYMWVLSDVKGLGWTVALAFATCTALRLARFNTAESIQTEKKKKSKKDTDFFQGIPAPASAALALWPMMISFETGWALFSNPWFCSFYVAAIAALTVSKIPTYSFKRLAVRSNYILLYMLGIVLLASSLVTHLWETMSVIGICYIALIPFAYRKYKSL